MTRAWNVNWNRKPNTLEHWNQPTYQPTLQWNEKEQAKDVAHKSVVYNSFKYFRQILLEKGEHYQQPINYLSVD